MHDTTDTGGGIGAERARFHTLLIEACEALGLDADAFEGSGYLRYDGEDGSGQWVVLDGHYSAAQVEAVAEALRRLRAPVEEE